MKICQIFTLITDNTVDIWRWAWQANNYANVVSCLGAWLCSFLRRNLSLHRSHWLYCAFDLDRYHDSFIVPGIWQTKGRKWLGVTQGIWRGMWGRAAEKGCVCHQDRGGRGARYAAIYVSPSSVQDRKDEAEAWTIHYNPWESWEIHRRWNILYLNGISNIGLCCCWNREGARWVGCVVTCSTVRGEQISSPLRIMERWVNTSDSWKESRPSSSLTLLTTATHTATWIHTYTNVRTVCPTVYTEHIS